MAQVPGLWRAQLDEGKTRALRRHPASVRSDVLRGGGLVARGRERMGEEATVWDLGEKRRVRIVAPCSYDPKGERLDV